MVLNVGAVGLALAAAVAGAYGATFDEFDVAMVVGLPTLLVGTLWAWILRLPRTVGRHGLRLGWAASVPLAALNSGVVGGLLLARSSSGFLTGAFLGVTLGALFWIPALMATLLCFGLPIAWAQRLAQNGLSGEERGEWIVGFACVVTSLLGMLVTFGVHPLTWESSAGVLATRTLALGGALMGASAAGLALARETRRRRFVADAEAGRIAGYRVDPMDEGKVLMRVVSRGKGYREADFEEEVFEFDAEGEATRPAQVRAVVDP
jgi:hypothetical protein